MEAIEVYHPLLLQVIGPDFDLKLGLRIHNR